MSIASFAGEGEAMLVFVAITAHEGLRQSSILSEEQKRIKGGFNAEKEADGATETFCEGLSAIG